ncbi:PREDICTED: trinucleotide repeat-containing gene 6C protein isoform X1 [Cyphomyrmex costatus]|uniref:trinucleotide repeat-containing gene 6C protein isoform X1 n=1 Tax=Cyphomyrmex costatus TaxID=456900 RepID=UPI0008524252|nr:PREDICTED: trinucleotide repeat-containing gene 6C protein isoform X1 [Cyphomyrmex costatus]XP_018401325.1 PREDICTED: trinucleotide repeat-containing gene 6C protein isoform X1 [Cyphomyrmex costatus]
MFPHNSSSHEISTETNAFVQNSMGDVVVLEESSLDGVGEGEGSEHIRYCDIESIANSSMMAAPISHPEATAANDFSTVLLNQAGEFNSTGIGKACQSVAPATTKYPTNHPQICDNNNKINNHNNAEHNHHKYRKQNTPGLLGLQLGSSANNSKSTCKTLSDNKTSFSTVYIRVYIRVSVNFERDEMCYTVGVPSLVRIPKSDSPQRLLRLPNSDDNYSLLGSCLDLGDNNKFKANFSYVSNNNSKSVILLSSTSYSNHYLLFSGGFDKIAAVIPVLCIKRDDSTTTSNRMKLLGDKYALVTSFAQISRLLANDRILDDSNSDIRVLLSRRIIRHLLESHLNVITLVPVSVHAQNFAMYAASSSITLIVSRNEVIDHTLRSFLKNLTQLYVQSSISPLCNVTVTELMQHICVPLLIICKSNDYNVGNNYNEYYNEYSNVGSIEEEINISNNNPDVIEDIVDIAVCYKTSVMTTNVRILGSQNDGISCTEATIYTVGALLFQDNNKPLNTCFKISRHRGLVTTDRESNSTIKSVFRSKLSDKCSNVKFETSHAARLDESDNSKQVKLTVNIPIMTTCKPTMTLTCQSATVASQTIVVPVSRAESRTNDNEMRLEYFIILQNDQICIQYMLLSHTDDLNKNDLCRYDATKFKDAQIYAIDKLKATTTSKDDAQLICKYHRDTLKYDQSRKNDDDNAIICNGNEDFSLSTTIWHFLKHYVRELISDCRRIYNTNKDEYEVNRRRLRSILDILIRKSYVSELYENYNESITSYKQRWGIPIGLRLVGGGESSLNSGGAANWGTTQATTPNNNNTNQSGWGGTPGNPPGSANAPNNWGGNTVNRSVTGNPNQNQNQGPPGNQNNPGNVSKVNNPNQQSNQQSGPPTSQSNNPTQGNQNNNQWSQGKSNNPSGLGQNPSVQNNNSSGVQQQQSSGSSANNNQSNNPTQGAVSIGNTSTTNNPSTKQQLEQLNTMREALFSHDGWGCQNVNQDTNWDVPTSPEPSITKDGVPIWKPPVNNGTDLWEANLRNGGQPPPQQQTKTPWGHTPATNIGGTWGEDDETADSSNMWTGAPTQSQPSATQWTGAAGNQAGSNWGDSRIDHRDPRDLRSVDPREMRDPRDHRMSLDPRDHMRVMDPMARDPRMADMRGDPRGISGRLHGANADAMWSQPPGPPHHQMGHQHPSGPPAKMLNPSNMNQWAAQPPKDIMPGKPSGWEEPSPPTQRRNVPNYDDGTSLWGNPAANQRAMPGSKVSHWKDIPAPNLARGGMQCPPGMPQNRMPGQPGMKPDVSNPMWGHPGAPGGRNGTWTDGPHDTASWDDPKTPATWNEPPLNPGWGGPTAHKPKPMGPAGSWTDSDMDPTPSWAHPAKPTLTKEVIWNSREFRYLCDLGFKKEDVEVALRNREMNREEALELLNQIRPVDQWRRHETHSGYDPTHQATTTPAYPRFNHVGQQMSFPPGGGVPSGATSGGVGGSVTSASLLKLQQQQQQQTAVPLQQQQPSINTPQPPFNQASRASQNQPSTQQLRMLVQQIQLAVHEGYLNHQILNQPLAPQTLMLLNQLLQQIKVLQQLHQQHAVQNTMKGSNQSALQISVQITKTKQQITNLQNQIAVQQATYMKQQQQHPAPPSQASEYYKSSVHDPMTALQNSFSDISMNKEPPVSQQQSRLNQWKLPPSLDKDGDLVSNEFSRAPGTTSKPPTTPGGLTQSHSSPNMNPLLGQGDGTWSSRLGDSGWPDPSNSDSTDGKDWQPGGAAYTDLVPEFEPGKPWKGTQIKSIEDDPSITPGSVVRSPLSLATIKDTDTIFSSSSKTSPPPQTANPDTSIPSLSNSTWTFNPPVTTPSAFTSTSKNTWGESAPPPTAVTSELWGAPMSKARGPPPGLSSKGATNASNGWGAGLGSVSRSTSSWGLQSSTVSNSGWMSTWLLLKNLTPQIDGSTLKTLCMQHGPVQDFRLYQNHGIALTKYSSRDEAIKAQGALNNCVLGNTTIFAESPAESEVAAILQQLGHGGQQQAGGSGGAGWGLRPTNKAGPPPDTWGGSSSQLWGAPPTSNSLWSNAGIDNSDQQRATPSSLNSYLPGDLLGGESM